MVPMRCPSDLMDQIPDGEYHSATWEEALALSATFPDSDPECLNRSSSLCCVCLTSGPNGRPKCVGIPHRAVRNFLSWYIAKLALEPSDRIGQICSPLFECLQAEVRVCACV